jgi:BA14K-like protein
MNSRVPTLVAAVALGLASLGNVASAAPVADGVAIKNVARTDVESVRWRGGWGWGLGAGIIGGAIIGSAIAGGPYYYGPGPYYGPEPYYAPPAYYGGGDAVAYCARRFRSYDPGTGTYLGNDGARHPCP